MRWKTVSGLTTGIVPVIAVLQWIHYDQLWMVMVCAISGMWLAYGAILFLEYRKKKAPFPQLYSVRSRTIREGLVAALVLSLLLHLVRYGVCGWGFAVGYLLSLPMLLAYEYQRPTLQK